MSLTNEPRQSSLAGTSDHHLLVLILTELRLQTYLSLQREVLESEIEGLRAEIMNDVTLVDTEATGTAFPAGL